MATQNVYAGQNGTVVLEAESAKLQGEWASRTVDGEKGVLWDADRSNYGTVDPDEKLTYTFATDEDGTYYAALHSTRVKSVMNDNDRYENGSGGDERSDTGNDIYFGIKDAETGEYVQQPIKLFTGLGDTDQDLRWGTTFDGNGGKQAAKVTLEANKAYELEITGRSDGYFLDKITLNKGAALKDADATQSPLEPLVAEVTPPVVQEPVEDPVQEDDIPQVEFETPVVQETPQVEETPQVDDTPTPVAPLPAATPTVADTPSDDEPETPQTPEPEEDDSDDSPGFFGAIFEAIGSFFQAIFSIFGGGSGSDSDETTSSDVAGASAAAQGPEQMLLSELIPVTGIYDETMPETQDDDLEDDIIS